MIWEDLVPEYVAISQRAWERRQMALRARNAGLKYREIATKFGCSPTRAQQLATEIKYRKYHQRSPIEIYLSLNEFSLHEEKWRRFHAQMNAGAFAVSVNPKNLSAFSSVVMQNPDIGQTP